MRCAYGCAKIRAPLAQLFLRPTCVSSALPAPRQAPSVPPHPDTALLHAQRPDKHCPHTCRPDRAPMHWTRVGHTMDDGHCRTPMARMRSIVPRVPRPGLLATVAPHPCAPCFIPCRSSIFHVAHVTHRQGSVSPPRLAPPRGRLPHAPRPAAPTDFPLRCLQELPLHVYKYSSRPLSPSLILNFILVLELFIENTETRIFFFKY